MCRERWQASTAATVEAARARGSTGLSSPPERRHARMKHVQQRRKNPPPVVHEAQGNGCFLLAHGEPQDPCPVPGCRGTLRFLHR
jgi:hypothetical protein